MGKQQIFPRVWTILKNVWKLFWGGAKYFFVDAGIFLLSIFAVIYCVWIKPEASLEGAVGILIAYSMANVFRFNGFRKDVRDLKKELDGLQNKQSNKLTKD